MVEFIRNDQLQLAFDFVQYTGKHIFLTGKAGTGKTTFLHQLKKLSPKRMVVVAPTGVAAINAGGVTIHSFFQLPFGPFIAADHSAQGTGTPNSIDRFQRFNREKISILKSLDLLVIDEISMVRSDLLDGIDSVLRRYKDRNQPFGGVQLLMIGDLQQLAPVAKDDEWNLLKQHYESIYFFSSLALRKTEFITIELTHIFRQRDEQFIQLLNKIRDNDGDQKTFDALNKRFIPGFTPADTDGYITLTTHNAQAQSLNENKLNKLSAKTERFTAIIEGDFPEYSYPTEFNLHLKEGAQVMFVKNDISRDKLFYNGKIGTVVKIAGEVIHVRCKGDADDIQVGRAEWQNTKYTIDEQTKEIKESIVGVFRQIPLKLAWAITIHKSQGLTFDRAIIDANAAFAHGQVYVALSRCKTLEGMVLSTPISGHGLKSDSRISLFNHDVQQNPPGQELLSKSKLAFQRQLLLGLFDFIPLSRRTGYCAKLMFDHKESIHPILREGIIQLNKDLKTDLLDVAYKFKDQIVELIDENNNIEENLPLQSRIRKASLYFSDKLALIVLNKLKIVDVEIDNKGVKKSVLDIFVKIMEEAYLIHCCLLDSKEGFYVKRHLEIRAKAAIDPQEKKLKTKSAAFVSDSAMPHPDLYKKLKIWRNQKADELDVDSYLILPQKTLLELVTQLPASIKELKTIKGLGAKKITQFGHAILLLIIQYKVANKMHVPDIVFEVDADDEENRPSKVDTKQITKALFDQGRSIADIARERTMTVSTIEGHLAHFVGTGDLQLSKFVTKDKVNLISEWFLTNNTSNIGKAKAALGDQANYAELKFVLKYLSYSNQISG